MGEETTTGKTVWLLAGQQLLRQGGIGAVKLHELARQSGLTTGSFYHHFPSMSAYLDALASFFASGQVSANLLKSNHVDPPSRLLALIRIAQDDELLPLDRAMRDWAGSNEIAAKAVEATDKLILDFMVQAFLDLDFDRAQAQLRAHLLISIGVARVIPPWETDPDVSAIVLDLLTTK